ncbi:uncharacterized protein M421DRAFT_418488 [Didymella exigua CBS 183.55]|uniref:Uncharacterized protein n=1 Tax=Didymella exigua CBS 183.55 TaxID=1150837 RepID=A0A6A5S0F8_9PLEO|nr:uncharacterized protein M421DRAFT_418488 [Didymella exigua CBS 183.55]KAF1930997.1 hypothetical protein M421DRAFT_418488 [Didymella exigua CBS 183.55]
MPRQLPWKSSGGGGSRTQTIKPATRKTKTAATSDDVDDDFFDGTVSAGSSKDKGEGKSKAKAASDSDSSLPEAGPSPHTPKSKRTEPKERAHSSSPPPLADCAPPRDEPMRKGVSKFDLRDDEWMMVEDEFLETAKLFTRHLHIAEYDRLKERIEAKKKDAGVARPVVAGAKRSVDGAMKERARIQESRQKKAIRDVFASQGESSEDDRASCRPEPSNVPSITARCPPPTNEAQETDSDDLDAPRPPKPKEPSPTTLTVAKPLPATRPRPAYPQKPKPAAESFVKPSLPATTAPARPRARPSRMTPFDMLDEYTPPTFDTRNPPATPRDDPRSQSTSSAHSSSQTSETTTTRTVKPRRSIDLLDDWGSLKDTIGISKEVADRIAKRKIERAKEGDATAKKRVTNLDDIPTFLF